MSLSPSHLLAIKTIMQRHPKAPSFHHRPQVFESLKSVSSPTRGCSHLWSFYHHTCEQSERGGGSSALHPEQSHLAGLVPKKRRKIVYVRLDMGASGSVWENDVRSPTGRPDWRRNNWLMLKWHRCNRAAVGHTRQTQTDPIQTLFVWIREWKRRTLGVLRLWLELKQTYFLYLCGSADHCRAVYIQKHKCHFSRSHKSSLSVYNVGGRCVTSCFRQLYREIH